MERPELVKLANLLGIPHNRKAFEKLKNEVLAAVASMNVELAGGTPTNKPEVEVKKKGDFFIGNCPITGKKLFR